MAGLSDAKVRAAKSTGSAYKLSDGQQLYLHVSAIGGRTWRMNYQFGRTTRDTQESLMSLVRAIVDISVSPVASRAHHVRA